MEGNIHSVIAVIRLQTLKNVIVYWIYIVWPGDNFLNEVNFMSIWKTHLCFFLINTSVLLTDCLWFRRAKCARKDIFLVFTKVRNSVLGNSSSQSNFHSKLPFYEFLICCNRWKWKFMLVFISVWLPKHIVRSYMQRQSHEMWFN